MNRILIGALGAFAAVAVLLTSAAIGLSQAAPAAKATCGLTKVPLGTAANFRVLGASSVTNTGATVVKGNLGTSPGTSVTGFPPGKVAGTIHKNDTAAAKAQADLGTAYTNATGRTNCAKFVSGNVGGQTLGPGLYVANTSLAISSGNLTLDAQNHSLAVFIFKIGTTFTTTSGHGVILKNGANVSRIYWAVGSSATLGSTSVVYGNILAHVSISLATGATVHGRALANTGAVTLAGNKLSR
jgi:hypothetical protein